ncbi:hypothetical protein K0U83_08095 [bacterium]|jgi:hypothetical protein|nr:hypothetical protein [bacterium]
MPCNTYTYYDELGGFCRQPAYPRPLFHARLETSSRSIMRVKYRMWRQRWVNHKLYRDVCTIMGVYP